MNGLDFTEVYIWIIPLAIMIAGLILGLFFEWIIVRTLGRIAIKTHWRWDDVLAKACNHIIAGTIFIAGIWLATVNAPLGAETEQYIIKILNAAATLIAILFLARLTAGFINLAMATYGKALASTSLITNSVKLIIIAVGFIFVLNQFVPITPIIGALGIGGLAAALALQDTLSNLFSGFQIIATRQVRPGDYVQLENGALGVVTDVNWRNVQIRSHPDENLVIVPNNKVATSVMINYNLPRKALVEIVEVGVSYDSDLEQVEKVSLQEAVKTIKDISGKDVTTQPQIRFREFGASSINLQIRMTLPELKGRGVYKSELIKRLHKRFRQEGIEIPFPIRTLRFMEEEIPKGRKKSGKKTE